jgi:hypothetical protein
MNYRPLIEKIVTKHTAPALTVSLRDIIDLIEAETGQRPSTNTVSYILRELGIDTDGGHVWAYRHNKERHE